MNPIEFLGQTPLFKDFSESGRALFAKKMSAKKFKPGAPVYREGEIGEALYLIVSGKMGVFAKNKAGDDVLLAELQVKDCFGEISFLTAGAHLSSVISVAPAVVLELTRKDFLLLQKEKPQTCLKLLHRIIHIFGLNLKNSQQLFMEMLEL
jgi:CRP/FNR family transcriptional regulator